MLQERATKIWYFQPSRKSTQIVSMKIQGWFLAAKLAPLPTFPASVASVLRSSAGHCRVVPLGGDTPPKPISESKSMDLNLE